MPTTTYAHFRDVPDSSWRWPSFSPAEIACRGTGAIKINTEAMDKLQSLRNRLGKPLIVRSGYRSPSHNRAVGGAPASKHMLGTAFDIAMSNHDPVAFAEAARAVGFLGFGTYPRSGFMHIDLGPARSWGERFAPRATPFVTETQSARDWGDEWGVAHLSFDLSQGRRTIRRRQWYLFSQGGASDGNASLRCYGSFGFPRDPLALAALAGHHRCDPPCTGGRDRCRYCWRSILLVL